MSQSGPELAINLTGLPGCGKSSLIEKALLPLGFSVYRPSDEIRKYAAAQGFVLKSRADYGQAHKQMVAKDPEVMVRPIFEAEGLLAIDGLRVFSHACKVRAQLGTRFYTATLDCPRAIRYDRVILDKSRDNRDASGTPTYSSFVRDETTDLMDPFYDMYRTMDMHNLTSSRIDARRPLDELVAELQPIIGSLIPHNSSSQ